MTIEEATGWAAARVSRPVDLRLAAAAAACHRRAVPASSRWTVACAALIPVLLVGGWLIADAVQPASYSVVRQTVSVTAGYGGTDRWIMTAALTVIGCCYLTLVVELDELGLPGRIGLLVAGAAAFGIAACPEPASGTTGQHAAFTALGAVAISVWPALVVQPSAGRVITSVRVCAVTTAVFVGLLGWLVVEVRRGDMLGIAERVSSSVDVCWPLVVGLALRSGRPAGRARASRQPQR